MCWKRFVTVAVTGVGVWLLLCGTVLAGDASAAPRNDGDKTSDASGPQAKQPAGSETEQPGPPGLRRGRGPGGPRPFGPWQGGRGPAGSSMRPGPPNRSGPPDLPIPRWPGHPGGRPRWPHADWDTLQKGDPEIYGLLKDDHDLERWARELAIQYRRAPASQRPALREQLDKVVNRHFEVRQQRRRLELKRLEEELRRLREAIEHRDEGRKDLVAKRLSELLEEDNLGF